MSKMIVKGTVFSVEPETAEVTANIDGVPEQVKVPGTGIQIIMGSSTLKFFTRDKNVSFVPGDSVSITVEKEVV